MATASLLTLKAMFILDSGRTTRKMALVSLSMSMVLNMLVSIRMMSQMEKVNKLGKMEHHTREALKRARYMVMEHTSIKMVINMLVSGRMV